MTALALLVASLTVAAPQSSDFTDPLRLSWPWDLTYRDVPRGTLGDGPVTVTFNDTTRPAQVVRVGDTDRVWFVATLPGVKPKDPIPTTTFTLAPGKADPGIVRRTEGKLTVIDNGVYEFRLPRSTKFDKPVPLRDATHWLAGVRAKGEQAWDGRAWFDGNAPCTGFDVEVVREGPVFIDVHVRYHFDQPTAEGQTPALPLEPGKRAHLYEPNRTPRESVPAEALRYEAVLRFVMGDPWVDVTERFRLPRDPEIKPWGVHGYIMHFGRPNDEAKARGVAVAGDQHTPIDSVMWVRWFEYDAFGGNVDQKTVPAEPRPAQKGRPFALLRPIWNQGGGGAQDFFLTGGGGEDPQAPAVGVVAAFASKWVNPWEATIAAYAYDGDRGVMRFPLTDGARADMHYGQRAFGLCVGRAGDFRSINNVVRRHTDWTLAAQMNAYVLQWPRDPAKAGPSILLTRQQLDGLRRAYRAGDKAVREPVDEALAKAAKDSKGGGGRDGAVARLIAGQETQSPGKLPSPDLWLGRRYQDDFLNPTSGPIRRLKDIGTVDLFADGRPQGGAEQAALGYILTDLDAWIGYHHGWAPGNPNFHTDQYMMAAYVAALLRDHPHADRWLGFALDNFREDQQRVLLAPDGVGYECPGYAGYSASLQLSVARIFLNAGFGNPIADNPLTRANGTWHRLLLTPVDPRLGRRHEAPIGDTHRWDSGLMDGFGVLATYWRDADPAFAAEVMGVWRTLQASGVKGKDGGLLQSLLLVDPSIDPTPMEKMDWSSRTFAGFGAVLRDRFGEPGESFLSVKAGPARGHYHNDETSFHYYTGGTPVALDYNCSYSPRGDHAALHNTVTLGRTGTVRHNGRGTDVEAMEQPGGVASVEAFGATKLADAVRVERRVTQLSMSPVRPEDGEFSRDYPSRRIDPVTQRRTLVLVKHSGRAGLDDYLVVLDEAAGNTEAQQLNLHLLARDATVGEGVVTLEGQWGRDMALHLVEASGAKVERRAWWYLDPWMDGREEFSPRSGESVSQWTQRVKGMGSLPAAGWKPRYVDQKESGPWRELVDQTQGLALVPPDGWKGTWTYGEYQVWLRVHTDPGTPMLWVLTTHERGGAPAQVERLEGGRGVRVTRGGVTDEITFDGDVVVVKRGGEEEKVLQ